MINIIEKKNSDCGVEVKWLVAFTNKILDT